MKSYKSRGLIYTQLIAILALYLFGASVTAASSFYVKPEHPRIWLTPERLATLKARAAANTAEWQRFKEVLDRNEYDDSGYIIANGLAYQVTGDTQYAERVVQKINSYLDRDIAGDSGFESRRLPPNEAIGFDWCYDYLTEEQKTTYVNHLNTWRDIYIEDELWADKDPADNYFYGDLVAQGLTGLATYGDNPRAQEFIDETRWDRFEARVLPFLDGYAQGGDWPEGWNYGLGVMGIYLPWYLEGVRTATGENLFESTSYFRDLLYLMIHITFPTFDRIYPSGDWSGTNHMGWLSPYMRMLMLKIGAQFTTDEPIRQYVQWWLNHVDTYVRWFPMKWADFFWYDSGIPEIDYRNELSPHYFSPGTGLLVARSDWDEDATWVSFKCGPRMGSHSHHDQNSFTIFKHEWLAPDINVYSKSGINQRTPLHNSMLIDDMGQSYYVHDYAHMEKYEASQHYVYAMGDASKAYNDSYRGNILDNFTRQFLYIRPDYVIIFDRVRTADANSSKQWLLHFKNEPTISSNLVTGTNEGGKLFSKTLMPEDYTISKTGKTLGYGDIRAWTVEVQPAHKRNSDLFLHVLYATDVSTPSMVAAARVDGATLVGAQIDNYVAMFSKEETQLETGQFDITGSGLFKAIVADLVADTDYNVSIDGSILGSFTASNNGVVYFDLPLDGTHSIIITSGVLDSEAPASITDLTASTGSQTGEIDLNWTATGDDGSTGTASSYIVRYSLSEITSANWDSATDIDGEPSPKPAGTSESLTITGLAEGKTHYFATKVQDEAGNISGISNSPSAVARIDDVPPSVPSNLTATVLSSSQIKLNWSASTDDSAVAGYKVYRDGSEIGTSTVTSYSDTGLSPETPYTYAVSAYDTADNESGESASATTSTFAGGPTFEEKYGIPSEGLILWLDQSDPRSQGDIANWYDISGSGNHGTQTIEDHQPTITAEARDFDGVNDKISIADSETISPREAITVSALVYPRSTGKAMQMVSKYSGWSGYAYNLSNSDDSGVYKASFGLYIVDSGHQSFFGNELIPNAWNHIVGTYDGATTRIYQNGVETNSKAQSGSIGTDLGRELALGLRAETISGNAFDGLISQVIVFSRALTAEEVQNLYREESGPLAIITLSLPNGEVDKAYSAGLQAIGGTSPYAWRITAGDLPDGLTLDSATGVISGTPTSAAEGLHSFTAQVTDSESDIDTKELSIAIMNSPPTAEANADVTSGLAPLTVKFTGLGTDPDGTIVSYAWDFGDGGSSDEQNPTYTYNDAGNYNATLTVTDDDGATGSSSVNIMVTTEGATVINLTAHDYPWGDGPDNLVSNGIPFRPGVLFDEGKVRVLDGATEVPIATKILAYWLYDDSIRAILIQFYADFAGETKDYTLEIGTQRTTTDITLTPVTWDLSKKIATLPAEYLCDSLVVWEQKPLGQTDFPDWEQKQLDYYYTIRDVGTASCANEDQYYNSIHSTYQIYARTGELDYVINGRKWALHHRRDQIYLEGDLIGHGKCSSWEKTRYTYVQGLVDDYFFWGDEESKRVSGLVADNFYMLHSDSWYYKAPGERGAWTEREPAFALLGLLAHFEATNDQTYLDEVKRRVDMLYQMQVDNGGTAWVHNLYDHDPSEGCSVDSWGSSPWMSGLLLEAIIKFHKLTGDANASESIFMALDYLKENCLATTGTYAGKSFVYLGCPAHTTGVPDLDNMISHAYAYGYKISGYTREDYLSLATTIFNTAVSYGYAGSSKHFNQQFRTSGHTVAYLTLDGGNISPVAVASASPTTGEAPLEVNFNGSASSDPDGTIVSYEWNFGDGNTSDQQNPAHTYSIAGGYAATLIVTDNDGATGSDSLTITVTSETETIYSDIPMLGDTNNWSPFTPGYWEVAIDPTSGDRAYFLNDTARSDFEYTLFDVETYENFTLTLRARTAESSSNAWRDYMIVFGFQDPGNYYYAFFNASDDDSTNGIIKRESGIVTKISDLGLSPTILDDLYHDIEVTRAGSEITVKIDGVTVFAATDTTFSAGRIGLGSYNDSAYFDDVNVIPIGTLGQPGKPIHIDP